MKRKMKIKMGLYWDKYGKKIDVMQWAKLLEQKDYKIVKQELLPNKLWVSTVWLGLDYGFGMRKPIIFETMVFDKNNKEKYRFGKKLYESIGKEMDMNRYCTLEEAIKGHKKLVNKWSKKTINIWKKLK